MNNSKVTATDVDDFEVTVIDVDDFEVTVIDVDTVFEWQSAGDTEFNQCRIRIFWLTWETAIVIATDIDDNPGSKIAHATAEIVSFVNNLFDLVPNKTMLIEHYPSNNNNNEDVYLQVLTTDGKAVRYEIEKSKLVELLGKPI